MLRAGDFYDVILSYYLGREKDLGEEISSATTYVYVGRSCDLPRSFW